MTQYAPNLSQNELTFYITRAAVGAGFSYGQGEEIARFARSIYTQNIDACQVIAPALKRVADKDADIIPNIVEISDGFSMDAENGATVSALSAAIIASDFLKMGQRIDCASIDDIQLFKDMVAALFDFDVRFDEREGFLSVHSLQDNPTETTLKSVSSKRPHMDETCWQIIYALFAHCLVASTESSRLMGAGAGLNDND